jgi:predicted ribosome quality control (RQC) complex YloA/Tae2 family protein
MNATPESAAPLAEQLLARVRALRKQRARLARKVEAIRGDLAEAERAPEHRRHAEALLAYLAQVPKRASSVKLPDPHDASRELEIALDSGLTAQANAARYFKRAAKGERGGAEIRTRLERAESDLAELEQTIEAGARVAQRASSGPGAEEFEAEVAKLPRALSEGLATPRPARAPARDGVPVHKPAPPRNRRDDVPARLLPRRLRTEEGWDVLIGRSNEGNDHLTLHLARPEDYWFHVHGAAGSHVVLRRGKGKNEPSRRTLEEVAGWTAFYSQARTAGKVPVIWTLKKYVRKPRGAKAGTVVCEREKSLMVRPREPDKSNLADSEKPE